ncbi:hypothetical protein NQ315_007219 [Exocentrus adspersus]|uniref:Uncharacterized protein n=1 Tax=Exocentrus adspersus TaxID=1586481 RepID=A0AAV8WDM8_9CUCU|nr:hypothetical protein NQ315_007219 [Exocentrus adspersus]
MVIKISSNCNLPLKCARAETLITLPLSDLFSTGRRRAYETVPLNPSSAVRAETVATVIEKYLRIKFSRRRYIWARKAKKKREIKIMFNL